jgi:hypothetical protein
LTVEELKSRIAVARPGALSSRVIDYLVASHAGEGTFYSPSYIARQLSAQAEAVYAILLAMSNLAEAALAGKWIWVDNEDEQHEISVDDVEQSLTTGQFFHPETGDAVPNFRDRLGMIFESTAEFDHAVQNEKKKTRRPLMLALLR